MRREEEVRLTHSGIFAKDGRRCVSVRFERGRDVAEAILPACRVTKNEGFTDEEVRGLEQYLESKMMRFCKGKGNQSDQGNSLNAISAFCS